jgi:UDP-N-acetylmuramoyl-L-alanyl-D-glutamate--2,6-diaminopimelate ligase
VGAAAGKTVDVFGTLGSSVGGKLSPTGFTTPDAVTTQRLLREAADGRSDWVAMEVSSHALDQKRTFGTVFAAAVFTNLSRDHLDYHGTEAAYLEAKARLFLPGERGNDFPTVAVIHGDDPAGRSLWDRVEGPRASYGRGEGNDYRAVDVSEGPRGSRYRLVTPRGEVPVVLPLLGDFNVTNALAAQATAVELGVEPEATARALADAVPVRGRMELVDRGQPFLVVVDFAHTPDALERALTSLRPLVAGSLRVVFGCGGDRDAGKRPVMGATAARHADRVIVTSDNPRSEDPGAILDAVWEGIPAGASAAREPDRAAAIRLALEESRAGDGVLIAGKGHETEQIVGTTRHPFDDRAVATAVLGEHGRHDD